MLPEIERFSKWLRCRSPYATTHIHYTSDVRLFFAWTEKSPNAITPHDVDGYVAHCRGLGHAAATINRRLAALRAFYRFLDLESDDASANPILPRRHSIRKGQRLPRDAPDIDVEKLFSAITSPRDRAMFAVCVYLISTWGQEGTDRATQEAGGSGGVSQLGDGGSTLCSPSDPGRPADGDPPLGFRAREALEVRIPTRPRRCVPGQRVDGA
jgi:hypothetical protein